MTTWTASARQTLEGHLARLREGLASTGADPVEVAEDLRRHIDEELAHRRIDVVTTGDVETILQRLGLPDSPAAKNGHDVPARADVGERGEPADSPLAPPRRKGRWFLLFFGVVLPMVTLAIELATHMCAATFFDPIPGLLDVMLVAAVPATNFWVWRSVRSGRLPSAGCRWLGAASAFSLLTAAYYAVLYGPLTPVAAIAVIFFGWGLLPLSPLFAFFAAWRLRVLAGRIPGVEGQGGLRGWGPGLAFALLALVAVVLPPVLTRHWSQVAVGDDPGAAAEALRHLRAWGHERTLLADCYDLTRRSRDNPMRDFHAQGVPVPMEMARTVYFRVTGMAYNELPPPRFVLGGKVRGIFGDSEWDGAQGGPEVGGRVPGLSVAQSRIDGLVDADAGWAYTEWVLEFKNVAAREHEARAQIALPPGGVVSRVTLWVNGEEREAAFAGSADVRAAYEKVVRVYRRDPILVTHAGEDRVLMQCYPVPPNGGTMKVRLGITAPVELDDAATALVRWPRFIERNFTTPSALQHSVWLQSAQALRATHPALVQDQSKPGVFALHGAVPDADLGSPATLVRLARSARPQAAWVADPQPDVAGQFIRQELTETPARRPPRVVLVVDGSKRMADALPAIARALPQIPAGVELSLLLARDDVEEFSGPVHVTDPAWLGELAGRLPRVRAAGGQDNLPALARAWVLAREKPGSVVVWIHGAQPVETATLEQLNQRLLWANSAGQGPDFYDLQVVDGANRLASSVALLAPVHSLPRFGSTEEDLKRLFTRWRGEGTIWQWTRQRLEDGSMPEANRGSKSSKHLARLWARDEVDRRVAARQRDEAVRIAARHQLVTAVSGAVVLESKQQFDEAGLKAADPLTAPTVPEPGVTALLALGVVVALVRARRSRATAGRD